MQQDTTWLESRDALYSLIFVSLTLQHALPSSLDTVEDPGGCCKATRGFVIPFSSTEAHQIGFHTKIWSELGISYYVAIPRIHKF